jgi:propanol-preferring alcohol dehydrogenase
MTLFVIVNITSGVGPVPGFSPRTESKEDKRIPILTQANVVRKSEIKTMKALLRRPKSGGAIVIGVSVELGQLPFVDEKRAVGSVIGSRQDMKEVLGLASARKIKRIYEEFKLEAPNKVLNVLKTGQILARAVLVP